MSSIQSPMKLPSDSKAIEYLTGLTNPDGTPTYPMLRQSKYPWPRTQSSDGWMPVATTDALLEAVDSMGFCIMFLPWKEVRLFLPIKDVGSEEIVYYGFGETKAEAMSLALAKVEMARQEATP